ncbi:unnamed protein product [Ambrosiozyma monospora]|uniref:Unnamed protein product n=1 Tax=Ambrosiozyma monospora TaxID=43982 RepID=A0ACB5TYG3_AMBMO|nr:unnamed protein product [Ambrosiozyma monospora]
MVNPTQLSSTDTLSNHGGLGSGHSNTNSGYCPSPMSPLSGLMNPQQSHTRENSLVSSYSNNKLTVSPHSRASARYSAHSIHSSPNLGSNFNNNNNNINNNIRRMSLQQLPPLITNPFADSLDDDDDCLDNLDVQVLVSSKRRSKLRVINPDMLVGTDSDDEGDASNGNDNKDKIVDMNHQLSCPSSPTPAHTTDKSVPFSQFGGELPIPSQQQSKFNPDALSVVAQSPDSQQSPPMTPKTHPLFSNNNSNHSDDEDVAMFETSIIDGLGISSPSLMAGTRKRVVSDENKNRDVTSYI